MKSAQKRNAKPTAIVGILESIMSNIDDLIVDELKKQMIVLTAQLKGAQLAYKEAKTDQFTKEFCKHLGVERTWQLKDRVIAVEWSIGSKRYAFDHIWFNCLYDELHINVREINKKGVVLKSVISLATVNGYIPPDWRHMSLEPIKEKARKVQS